MRKVVILGAAGRDFHNFNVVFRNNPDYKVIAFTATQIPDIAGRKYPAELAGSLYPGGIPIVEESELENLARKEGADTFVFAYSDVTHNTVMHLASRAVAVGADFWLLGTEKTQLKSKVPVVSVCATRTGCGKSPVSRLVARELEKEGWKPVVICHPMPYGDLVEQRVQRFATLDDLNTGKCTIEEREEYEPHIVEGRVVYAGVDYGDIMRRAEEEGDLILWDGGNNDTPFYQSDLEIVVADPHRAGHELLYYPGEVNLRRAKVMVINKVDTAALPDIQTVRLNILQNNPAATIVETACRITCDHPEMIKGKRVLVVEDGPTLTHGEMPYGAGVVAAKQFGAAEQVDPRKFAVGSIRKTFAKFAHLGTLLPAMGYSDQQRHELEETINSSDADVVLVATPVDLGRILKLNKPSVRVGYQAESVSKPTLESIVEQFCREHMPTEVAG